MTNENIVPLGSVTKTYTAIGIMRLVEEGRMDLNDTINIHVDKILMSFNGTTIQKIWNNNPMINDVTIYQLLHMTAGIADYDDAKILEWTGKHPDGDITPIDFCEF